MLLYAKKYGIVLSRYGKFTVRSFLKMNPNFDDRGGRVRMILKIFSGEIGVGLTSNLEEVMIRSSTTGVAASALVQTKAGSKSFIVSISSITQCEERLILVGLSGD